MKKHLIRLFTVSAVVSLIALFCFLCPLFSGITCTKRKHS
mgnify:CR=1 FL=1